MFTVVLMRQTEYLILVFCSYAGPKNLQFKNNFVFVSQKKKSQMNMYCKCMSLLYFGNQGLFPPHKALWALYLN